MAAIITDQNVTDFVHTLLGETDDKYWTDDEIELYKKMAMASIMSNWGYLLYPRYKTYEDIDMVADEETIAIPTNAQKVGKVEEKSTKKELRFIEEDEIARFTEWDTGKPLCWTFKGNAIWLLPTPEENSLKYFRVWYIEYMDTVTDFPEEFRPLIAVEAAILARTRDNVPAGTLLTLQQMLEERVTVGMAVSQMQEPAVFRDFELEEIYAVGGEIDGTLPTAPSGLAATASSSSQIDLTWTDTSDLTGDNSGFKVYQKIGAGAYAEIDTTAADVTTYEATGLSSSTQHCYKIIAYNINGDSDYSDEDCAITQGGV